MAALEVHTAQIDDLPAQVIAVTAVREDDVLIVLSRELRPAAISALLCRHMSLVDGYLSDMA